MVAFHAADLTTWGTASGRPLDRWFERGLGLLAHGHAAVGVFIVLSGYCLMRPVARGGGVLAGGLRGYLGRRARRILPSYHAALILSMGLIAAVPVLGRSSGTNWDNCLPAWGSGTLVSHAVLTHNLDLRHRAKINTPLWSVATEWQIYFAMPLLLLPIHRRLGVAAMVGAGFAVGLAPHLLLPAGRNYDTACPWYLGLFALGMAAATVEPAASASDSGSTWLRRVPWRGLARAGGIGLAVVLLWPGGAGPASGRDLIGRAAHVVYGGRTLWMRDGLIGLVTAVSLVAWTADDRAGRRSVMLGVFRSRTALGLGAISYSLYLTHYPILALAHLEILGGGRSKLDLIRLLAVGTPMALGVALGFHRGVERPSMARGRAGLDARPTPPISASPAAPWLRGVRGRV